MRLKEINIEEEFIEKLKSLGYTHCRNLRD
jgi:hypothetical protein